MQDASITYKWFADVALPLAVQHPYTYAIPHGLEKLAVPGMRVVVPLGKRKWHTGIILKTHQNTPKTGVEIKPILEFLDEYPLATTQQLELWQWIAGYYLCGVGEVMNAAIPAGFKLQSELKINAVKELNEAPKFSKNEALLNQALLHQNTLLMSEATNILGQKNPMRTINALIEKGVVQIEESLQKQQQAKAHKLLKLKGVETEENLENALDSLNQSKKQQAILLAIWQLKSNYKNKLVPEKEVLKNADASATSLKGLAAKGWIEKIDAIHPAEKIEHPKPLHLSDAQTEALKKIKTGFHSQKPVLLHGVTSSGKTEIYISLIKDALKTHQRALFLVPEISLTTQLINRLKTHFAEQAVVYHSRLSQGERMAVYKRLLLDKEPLVLLGARSALLLPFRQLGLIVIDEEHEASFKQHDPAPRYQARDAAIALAMQCQCPILLGSATPSAESYHHAITKKYELVILKERFGGVNLPKIELIDIRKETLWKTMRGHFSPRLLKQIETALKEKKRAILFQNRRGYTPLVQCSSCGHVHECPNCDISLTYHKYSHQLRCHFCGYSSPPNAACQSCGSNHLREVGFGTEKIEEELQTLLPEARIARMDWDTTRKKNAHARIISQFENGEIDVLIGTQMVTKGLDFEDVKIVGILNADGMLHYPDFRAQERAYQLLEQVAGRAGRRNEQGFVFIQSFKPEHRILHHVVNHTFENHMDEQLRERKIFNYPPFARLIFITFKHKDLHRVDVAAAIFAQQLVKHFPDHVLGPEYPPKKRLKNAYHKSILFKMPNNISLAKCKSFLRKLEEFMHSHDNAKGVRCIFDVDPY